MGGLNDLRELSGRAWEVRSAKRIIIRQITKLPTPANMSLNINVEVPVTASEDQALEQTRIKANGLPQAEDESQGPLNEWPLQQALEETREEGFDQGFKDAWRIAYSHWAEDGFVPQHPQPLDFKHLIHPVLEGG